MVFPMLKDWSERGKGQSAFDIMKRASEFFNTIPGAEIFVMSPPAVMELGNSSGFDMELMDRNGRGHDILMLAKDIVLKNSAKHPEIAYARYGGQNDSRQYELAINTEKAGALQLDKGTINDAISSYWGGEYINDFSDKGRTKKVYLQADPAFRKNISDFNKYYARNAYGDMVPFSSFVNSKSVIAPPKLTRYQGVPSVKIEGASPEGKSSGQAMAAMEKAAEDLPVGVDYAWTGLSLQEIMSGRQSLFLYSISIVVVFLVLAALYESWAVPLAVLLAIPAGIIGALAGICLREMNNDIYFQIAVLTIIGISAKNSILIVEFAKRMHDSGKSLVASITEACRIRFRPIIMTSLCFIIGVIPLAISSGAGSGSQKALGTAVIAGMLTSTALGIYFTPLFFSLVIRLGEKFGYNKAKKKFIIRDIFRKASKTENL